MVHDPFASPSTFHISVRIDSRHFDSLGGRRGPRLYVNGRYPGGSGAADNMDISQSDCMALE